MNPRISSPVLVVGAGIAGITTALETAESGHEVILVEREAWVGGRVLRNHQYFPKLCPPSCGMEINIRRLERNPRIQVWVDSQVTRASVDGQKWSVLLKQAPQYVNQRCTACGECSRVCPAQVPDSFNLGMNQVKNIRLSHPDAWPRRFTLDRQACPKGCQACLTACQYDAIDLKATPREQTLEISSVVLATGWKPYPLEKLTQFGGGSFADVISNVQMERMASKAGPTDGKILRPSDGAPPKRVAFVQCAGSRDVNHLAYCSAVCCLASFKQTLYIKEQLPDCQVSIFYIDRRAPGRNEEMAERVAGLPGVRLIKGKVGKIGMGPEGKLLLRVEDVEAGRLLEESADMVVLATGMVSNLLDGSLTFDVQKDDDGFGRDSDAARMFVAGVARRPEDVANSVREATAAAAKALVATRRAS